MNFRKGISILTVILTLSVSFSQNVSAQVSWPPGPGVASDAAILMDADTGTVLYSKNINAEMYPASITKLMTVLLVLENCSMDQVVTFSRDAVFNIEFGSNHIGMTVDEQITVEQALYGILLESANEVCNGVGELIAGSQDAFIEKMNTRAKELGCEHTHFTNPNGLHNKNHFSSAYDMAIITRECLKHEDFRRIAGTKSYQIPPTNKTDEVRYLNNQHGMFPGKKNVYEGFECGKTGFTDQALNTLVTVAKRDNLELICVTMHGNLTHYKDTAALLDYGFASYKHQAISTLDANLKNDYYMTSLPEFKDFIGDEKNYTFEYDENAIMVMPEGASFSDFTTKLAGLSAESYKLSANLEYYYGEDLMGVLPVTLSKREASAAAGGGLVLKNPFVLVVLRYILIGIGAVIVIFLILYILARARLRRKRNKRRQHQEEEFESRRRRRR